MQAFAVVRKDKAKLEFRHPGKLFPHFLDLRGIETWNLDQDPVVPDWADNRFADAKNVDTFPNYLDRLVEHSLVHVLVAAHQADQKGRAALNIEAELNFFPRRRDRGDAERDQQHDQRGREQSFSSSDVSCEI